MENRVTVQNFREWINNSTADFASSVGAVNKSIGVKMNGTIFVKQDGKVIYEGMQTYPAIQKYNSIK